MPLQRGGTRLLHLQPSKQQWLSILREWVVARHVITHSRRMVSTLYSRTVPVQCFSRTTIMARHPHRVGEETRNERTRSRCMVSRLLKVLMAVRLPYISLERGSMATMVAVCQLSRPAYRPVTAHRIRVGPSHWVLLQPRDAAVL